jgi:hypothetical protein
MHFIYIKTLIHPCCAEFGTLNGESYLILNSREMAKGLGARLTWQTDFLIK